jgi:CDP-glucose 4,6-dehydratase
MTFDTNVMGTVNVLECVRLAPETVKSVVVITTDKVYDDEFDQVGGFKEDDPLNGYDPYSNSKSCADLATQCYADSFLKKLNIPITIFRAGNVIGGGDFAKNRIIPDFIRAWRNGESLELRQPYSIRPYQHVIEPLFAYLVMGATQAQDNISDIYNVGPNADNCVTTESLIYLMSGYFTGAKYKYTGSTFRENPKLTLNVDHIKENGIFPLWNIETTIEKTAEWYLTNSEHEWEFTQVRELMSKQIDEYCKLAGVKDE